MKVVNVVMPARIELRVPDQWDAARIAQEVSGRVLIASTFGHLVGEPSWDKKDSAFLMCVQADEWSSSASVTGVVDGE